MSVRSSLGSGLKLLLGCRCHSTPARVSTHVDDTFTVADQQVAEDAGFIQVSQTNHVLHPVDGGGVHGLDVGGILRGNPVFLRERESSQSK